MNCSTDWIEIFLKRVENEYIFTKRPIDELAVTLISEFMAVRNLSIPQAIESIKDLMQERVQLESETNHAHEMRIQSERELKSTLSKNKISMEIYYFETQEIKI